MSAGHRQALDHLRYGLENDSGFVLLTGEVGAGKTMVCRCLLEYVPDNTDVAFILNPKLSTIELLATICDKLAIVTPASARIKELIDAINDYLLTAHSRGRRTVLLIDEAQNLNVEILEQIRLLTNLEANGRVLLQVIMLGQPELQEKLAGKELKQLAQRISARFHLGPLNAAETTAYVRHRLSVAGMDPQIFSPASLKKLFSLSDGIPRLINIICERALMGACTEGTRIVDARIMALAGGEGFGGKLRRQSLRYISPWLVVGLTIVACGIVLLLLWHSPERHGSFTTPVIGVVASEAAAPGHKVNKAPAAHKIPPVWPAGQQAAKSEKLAMSTLLRTWGLARLSSAKKRDCRYAGRHGLRCLAGKTGLADLLRLNRPVILRMRNEAGQKFSMVLTTERGDQLELRAGRQKIIAGRADLARRWSGSYLLLWRPPPGYRGSIRPGHKGRGVKWLAGQLALATGKRYISDRDRPVFNENMVRQIKDLQFSHDFIPDGIVGRDTIILLNTLTGAKVPLLRKGGVCLQ
ncbi:MAG: AAA family ATPase [Deltaproteobacteria bacterium]|nr:AAA family ATPase [Deltaproteobacteria bacterium]